MLTDLRHAVRTLRRSPLFALSAILALALGVGANTAVFSVVYAVLLQPLPFDQPDRLVQLSEVNAIEGRDDGRVSRGTFADWVARTRTIAQVAAYSSGGEALWGGGERPRVVGVAAASTSLPRVLGVQPVLGRWFGQEAEAPGAVPQIVISYGLWQRMFGGAADVVGRTVSIEARSRREIIGVMPRAFAFPEDTEAWTNLALGGSIKPEQRRFVSYHAVGRMAGGATLADVRREFDALSASLAAELPDSNKGWTARVVPLAGADTAAARPALLALLAAVGGVLLIGCANVANLLLARMSSRWRDVEVRIALGASTARLARQSIAEALVLSSGGTLAGLALGHWLCRVLVRFAPPDAPRLGAVGFNGALVLFAAGAGVLSAVFIGFAPAIQAARAARRGELRAESRGVTARTALVHRLLIASEVAVVVVLLTGALLFLRTFVSLRGIDLGFHSEQVWNVSARWPIGRFVSPGTRPWPRVQRALDGLVEAVAAIPGVEAAGLIAD